MRHPIIVFLLARLDEEDPNFPYLAELRERIAELEYHLIDGGPLLGNEDLGPGVTKEDLALAGLKVAAFRYRDHPDYKPDWRLPFEMEPGEETTT